MSIVVFMLTDLFFVKGSPIFIEKLEDLDRDDLLDYIESRWPKNYLPAENFLILIGLSKEEREQLVQNEKAERRAYNDPYFDYYVFY